ncbi:MAG: GNAT family N-acetyltransferase [Clostridia bacterium]|nr:GNAT family N-acetyltransferase [Clostridia bacterium]
MNAVLYIHGKGGAAAEAEHYKPLFPEHEVAGLDYNTSVPWEAGKKIRAAVEALTQTHESVTLIANSIGAFFSLHADIDARIDKAFFISPITDMEALITGMMAQAGVTERDLQAKDTIPTDFGEDLSWKYLCYVRAHPIRWNAPTEILYGERDTLVPYETVAAFAEAHGASLTVMPGGEHWFHTQEQLRFLDGWLRRARFTVRPLKAEETEAALRLAWTVFTEFESPDYGPAGTEEFRKCLHDEAYLAGIRYYGAFDGHTLIGMLGVRPEECHICFCFVDGAYHRRGVGTRLLERMLADFPNRTITLNASPFGLPFYLRRGFIATDAEQTVNGIRFTPMKYTGGTNHAEH